VQIALFVSVPIIVMLNRLLLRWQEGLSALLRPPIGRVGDKRSPAAALRFVLFQQTQYGYYLDVLQVRALRAATRATKPRRLTSPRAPFPTFTDRVPYSSARLRSDYARRLSFPSYLASCSSPFLTRRGTPPR
jgi:hypothetical protein